jgi:hypothetical protein
VVLQLHHHDKASLFAGKLHAILQRPFLKGRDVYDLLWYLSDPNWPEPNLIFLNNALAQTHWKGDVLTAENWRGQVWDRIKGENLIGIVEDVRPFIEPGFDLRLLTLENLESLLRS